MSVNRENWDVDFAFPNLQLCFNEKEADAETAESQPYRGREFQSVFENFNADHN